MSDREQRCVDLLPNRKANELIGYLALHHDQPCSRSRVAAALWPERDAPAARACLRTVLWRVRSWWAECSANAASLVATKESLVLRTGRDDLWLDLAEVERTLASLGGMHEVPEDERGVVPDAAAEADEPEAGEPSLDRMSQALGLFRGDLLAGVQGDWLDGRRARVHRLELHLLERLMVGYAARDELDRAISCAERLLAHDPLIERGHRCLMRCHHRRGDRNRALRCYQALEHLLERELGVEPMAETQALYRRLSRDASGGEADVIPAGGDGARLEETSAEGAGVDPRQILPQLLAVQNSLEVTVDALRAAITHLQEAMDGSAARADGAGGTLHSGDAGGPPIQFSVDLEPIDGPVTDVRHPP